LPRGLSKESDSYFSYNCSIRWKWENYYEEECLYFLGTKSAIFNAICLALLDAGIAMKDFMVSCTTGYLGYDVLVGNNEQFWGF